ncbi:SsrA-binding protein SmpB [Patescibacteria group bacterium]
MAVTSLTKNKKAFADYEILETFEAGIQLLGPEVKSIRARNINLKGSFVDIDSQGEVWANEIHISPYKFARDQNLAPTRKRKLLLRQKEIDKILKVLNEQGVTCVPLEVYLKGGLIKMKIGLVKGKKKYDRRAELKKRSQNLEVARALKKRVQ